MVICPNGELSYSCSSIPVCYLFLLQSLLSRRYCVTVLLLSVTSVIFSCDFCSVAVFFLGVLVFVVDVCFLVVAFIILFMSPCVSLLLFLSLLFLASVVFVII